MQASGRVIINPQEVECDGSICIAGGDSYIGTLNGYHLFNAACYSYMPNSPSCPVSQLEGVFIGVLTSEYADPNDVPRGATINHDTQTCDCNY
ncbi:MAG: hypothetical protein AAFN77_16325 [Planctomycetota bacterium]